MKVAVVVFPGSNCDQDLRHACADVMGWDTIMVWHKETALPAGVDVVFLPGGFSYGDYLRAGAIARFSPVMKAIVEFAGRGGRVIGICNGFQVLTESGLLDGALMRNDSLSFRCEDVHVRVATSESALSAGVDPGAVLRIPIAHAEGRYFADEALLDRLRSEDRIVFEYCDAEGRTGDTSNPNGSVAHIAGITNAGGNVVGLMPHPERVVESVLGGEDGRMLLAALARGVG